MSGLSAPTQFLVAPSRLSLITRLGPLRTGIACVVTGGALALLARGDFEALLEPGA
jgi:hypothetical protein